MNWRVLPPLAVLALMPWVVPGAGSRAAENGATGIRQQLDRRPQWNQKPCAPADGSTYWPAALPLRVPEELLEGGTP